MCGRVVGPLLGRGAGGRSPGYLYRLSGLKEANRRAQHLRYLRIRNEAKREENNDYYRILSIVPAHLPDRDDIVSNIVVDLLTGALKREDVRARVQTYVTAHSRMFPTKYARFGNSPLVSLDEVLFEDGTATRGDSVTRGLWD